MIRGSSPVGDESSDLDVIQVREQREEVGELSRTAGRRF